jgi:serine O-acetyltransferase
MQKQPEARPSISLRTTLRYILSDLSRYRVTERRSYPAILITSPGLIAGVYYRLGHWLWNYRGRFALPLRLLRPFYMVFKRGIEIYSGASISPRAVIGEGLYINHFGSIFVGAVVIGENCNLSQEVTIGVAGRGSQRGMPTIGNRVYLAAGAKIFGQVTIGDDVAVGANAVVTKSIPDCAVVAGVPAKVISFRGSFDFILYASMHEDPARLANMTRAISAQTQNYLPI